MTNNENLNSSQVQLIKLRLHAFYIISGLVVAIILLATREWTPQEKFTEYLTNAATLVSVVLGLVAIFYSFISNDSLSKSLGSIATVSEQVAETREKIGIYVDRTDQSGREVKASAEIIHNASNDVRASIDDLSSTLAEMKRHTDGFQALAGAIPKSLGQLEATVLGATKSLSEKTRQSGGVTAGALADASVESHLRRSSLGLNLFALACVRAHEKGQLLDTVKFAAAINVNLNSYFAGALAAMHSVNIVRTDPTDSTYQVFKILDVNKHLSERVLPYFMDYITHTYEKKPNMLELWKSNLAKVEALFDNALIPA